MHPLLIQYSVVVLLCTVIQTAKSEFNVDHEINKFKYEKMHHYGKGRRIIQDYRRLNPFKSYGYEYPKALPTNKPAQDAYPSQWSAFTQGQRKRGDKRVFSKKFDYKARLNSGHKYFIDGVVECIISAVMLDTEGATPIKLRGGVGYNYFAFVVLAKVGEPIKGQLQAFCHSTDKKSIGRGGKASTSIETDIDRD